eukprot:TRINITY_DN1723_c0_g2_i4.p1 TRINITY_DN1723_c0_g2~~TRINITY_DN1723_c0_g2_i4.p1  ORF type:complete len:169 (-),score=49.37 TRINITY_DN1723_c0_g2_i4:465-971(-)
MCHYKTKNGLCKRQGKHEYNGKEYCLRHLGVVQEEKVVQEKPEKIIKSSAKPKPVVEESSDEEEVKPKPKPKPKPKVVEPQSDSDYTSGSENEESESESSSDSSPPPKRVRKHDPEDYNPISAENKKMADSIYQSLLSKIRGNTGPPYIAPSAPIAVPTTGRRFGMYC